MSTPDPDTRDGQLPPAHVTDRVSYDDWVAREVLPEIAEWNELLDSDEEFYLDRPADSNDPLDIAELNDIDDSLASDE